VHLGPHLSDQGKRIWFVGVYHFWLEFVQELEYLVYVLSGQGCDIDVSLAGALDAKNLHVARHFLQTRFFSRAYQYDIVLRRKMAGYFMGDTPLPASKSFFE
jgi:hypothetical protein